jgi:hypothetical protein
LSERLIRRIGLVLTAMAVMFGAVISPASAAGGPAINYFKTAVPIVGGVLSNSSSQPSFAVKDGWTLYDPNGVCSAYTDFYDGGTTRRIWNFAGSSSTKTVSGRYQWNATVNRFQELDTYATNCLGDSSSGYTYISPDLAQQGVATYSAGWSSAACLCWSGGSAMKSSTVGATANYGFYGRMVSFVSDKATSRGSVSLYIDGRFQKTVSLTTSGASVNRVIVWNSPYLTNGNHILTVKVASGRVDVDAFITQ